MSSNISNEPSALEHARLNGLPTDHRADDILQQISDNPSFLADCEVPELPKVFPPNFSEYLIEDKLEISKAAAEMLADIMEPPKISKSEMNDLFADVRPVGTELIESQNGLPNEMDMDDARIAGIETSIGHVLDMKDSEIGLPSLAELIHDSSWTKASKSDSCAMPVGKTGNENDKVSFKAAPAQKRVKITKDAMQYLQRVLRPQFPDADKKTLLEKAIAYSKNQNDQSIANQNQSFSKVPTACVLRGGGSIEKIQQLASSSSQKEESPSKRLGPKYTNSSLSEHNCVISGSSERLAASALKMKVPELPDEDLRQTSASKKYVAFSESLEEIITPLESDIIGDQEVLDTVNKIAADVENRILRDAPRYPDAALKVSVPKVDNGENSEAQHFSKELGSGANTYEALAIDGLLEKEAEVLDREREAQKNPVPTHLFKVNSDMEIDGTNLKRTEEDEITSDSPQQRTTLHELVYKVAKRVAINPTGQSSAKLRGGGFSTSDSISNYMKTRNRKERSPSKTQDDSTGSSEKKKRKTERLKSDESAEMSVGDIQVLQSPPEKLQFSLPPLKSIQDGGSRTIFFNSANLQVHQGLICYLEKWGGESLTIIYRELKPDKSRMHPPGSTEELMPDIILEPTKALLFTTMQGLSQRELPGTNSKVLFHKKLQLLSRCYETIFVSVIIPVSKDKKIGWFSDSHAKTTLEFGAYSSWITKTTGCQIKPIYIPVSAGSGDQRRDKEGVNIWTANMIASYALTQETENVKLVFLQDTTTWETFLCKSGLNVFAAQYVLGVLKQSNEGVRNFVQMPMKERMKRFREAISKKMLLKVDERFGQPTCPSFEPANFPPMA